MIAAPDRFKPFLEQEVLLDELYTRSLRINYHRFEINKRLLFSLARRKVSTFIARSKSSMTLANSPSISSIFCGWASPLNVLSAIISNFQIQEIPTAYRNALV